MTPSRRETVLHRAAWSIVAAWFLAAGSVYIYTGIATLVRYPWMFFWGDTWAFYKSLLFLPFPDNVLQTHNGHRPVIPNLIRLAEIRWFGASQRLQAGVGMFSAVCVVVLIVQVALRDQRLRMWQLAAVYMTAAIGVFW